MLMATTVENSKSTTNRRESAKLQIPKTIGEGTNQAQCQQKPPTTTTTTTTTTLKQPAKEKTEKGEEREKRKRGERGRGKKRGKEREGRWEGGWGEEGGGRRRCLPQVEKTLGVCIQREGIGFCPELFFH